MAIICTSVVSTDLFNFDMNSKMITSELSMFSSSKILSKIYDDACDIGFWILNSKTGNKTLWVLTKEIRSVEGDLMYLEFKPVQGRSSLLKHQDHANGWTMTIFND